GPAAERTAPPALPPAPTSSPGSGCRCPTPAGTAWTSPLRLCGPARSARRPPGAAPAGCSLRSPLVAARPALLSCPLPFVMTCCALRDGRRRPWLADLLNRPEPVHHSVHAFVSANGGDVPPHGRDDHARHGAGRHRLRCH